MKILTIPPSQREAFDAGEPVTVWVALPEQPVLHFKATGPGQSDVWRLGDAHGGERWLKAMLPSPLGPVGTRHEAFHQHGTYGDRGWEARTDKIELTVTDAGTVTQREGVWGVEGMVVKC